jgi:hypothetical protein
MSIGDGSGITPVTTDNDTGDDAILQPKQPMKGGRDPPVRPVAFSLSRQERELKTVNQDSEEWDLIDYEGADNERHRRGRSHDLTRNYLYVHRDEIEVEMDEAGEDPSSGTKKVWYRRWTYLASTDRGTLVALIEVDVTRINYFWPAAFARRCVPAAAAFMRVPTWLR